MAQFLPNLAPRLHIQCRQRFIQQEQLGLQSQRARNRDPLLLSPRKLCCASLVKPRQVRLFKSLAHPLAYHVPGQVLRAQPEGDVLKNIQMGEEHIILEDITKGTFLRWDSDMAVAIKIGDTFERDMPMFRVKQTCQQSQHSAFARATFAQQHSRFAHFGSKAKVEVEGVEMCIELHS
jgi:hypothetical protein